ncbi:MAG: FlgD immunoglobulin-like domain containing protein [Candidatus Cloacimonadaceae bacterium]
MKSLILLLTVLFLAAMLSADISQYYSFLSYTLPYTPINGTIVPNVVGDDHISNPVDIGFSFPYGINNYTQIKLSSNGFMALNPATGDTHYNDLASQLYCPVLAPLWDDTWVAGLAMVLLTGTAPDRVFTIQYSAVKWPYYLASSFNYQVKLYENGDIEFCYGSAQGNPQYGNASIGINMLPGGSGNFLSVTPGTFPTVSSTVANNMINAFPAEGMVYAFNSTILPVHDLAAVSITGPVTPILNETNNYTISICNHSTLWENNYLVELKEGNSVLASIYGPAIAPNETLPLLLSWNPNTTGIHVLHGNVVPFLDENLTNNETNYLNVAVMPQTVYPITVGEPIQLSVLPVNLWSYTSISETLYLESELGRTGTISALAWYNSYWSNVQNMHIKLWMGITDQEFLTSDWITANQLSPVFDGNVNFPSGQNVICIPLDTPFEYESGNLVVMFFRPWDTAYYSQQDEFYAQMGTIYRSLIGFSFSTVIDPLAPPTEYGPSRVIPRTTFYFTEPTSNPPEQTVISSQLLACYPNPFSNAVKITYDLKQNQDVTINVYNLKGQLVKTLLNTKKAEGHHDVFWDGTNNDGKSAAPGMYFIRMQLAGSSDSRKIILVK